MRIHSLPVHIQVYHTHIWFLRSQNRAPGPLEPELQMVEYRHVGYGNWTLVLCKSSSCSKLLSHLSKSFIFGFCLCVCLFCLFAF